MQQELKELRQLRKWAGKWSTTVSIRLVRLPQNLNLSTDHHSVLTLYIVNRF
jgi:hypothetical protein